MSVRAISVVGLALATSILLAGCAPSYDSQLLENKANSAAFEEAVLEETGQDVNVTLSGSGFGMTTSVDEPADAGVLGVQIAEVFAESELAGRQFNVQFTARDGHFSWSGYDASDSDRFVAASDAWAAVTEIPGLQLVTHSPGSLVQGHELQFVGTVATEAEIEPARAAIIEIVTDAGFIYREDGVVITALK